jgi:hypothetical protein
MHGSILPKGVDESRGSRPSGAPHGTRAGSAPAGPEPCRVDPDESNDPEVDWRHAAC